MDEWRSVVGFESYEVSNLGNLRRDNRTLVGKIDKYGYRQYCLSVDNKKSMKTAHSLVAKTFLGERPEANDVDHINHNKLDNRLENLRYITHQQNNLRIPNTNPLRNIHRHHNKYRVKISENTFHGSFDTVEEAIQRRDQILSQLVV